MPHITAPSNTANYANDPKSCTICTHPDRGVVERLLAAGVFVRDIAHEWGFQMDTIRRHNALHSTQMPSVDPASLIIHLRYLHEEASQITQKALYGRGAAIMKSETVNAKMAAIKTSLMVTREMINLTNAKHHIDPLVALPRWTATMSKIAKAVQAYPEAFEAVLRVMKQDGPQGSETYLRGGNEPHAKPGRKRKKVIEAEETPEELEAREAREAEQMAAEELHSPEFPEEEISDGEFPADSEYEQRQLDGPDEPGHGTDEEPSAGADGGHNP